VRVRDAVLHRDGATVDAVRLRYRSRPVPAALDATGTGTGTGERFELDIRLEEEFAGVSPGQTAVLLAGETIVGHGTICG